MSYRCISIFLLALFAPAWVRAHATDTHAAPGSLSLDEARRRAQAYSPTLAATRIGIDVAAARVNQAGSRPVPELGIEVENFGGTLNGFKRAESTFMLSQRFERGGKRGARLDAARAVRSLAESEVALDELDLARDVAVAFAEGLAAQERLRVEEEVLGLSADILRSVEEKVQLGAALRAEATRARVAQSLVQADVDAAREEMETSRRSMARLWGSSVPEFERFVGLLDSLRAVPGGGEIDSLINSNPRLEVADATIRLRDSEVRLEKSAGKRDLSVGAGYRLLDGTEDGAFVAGLSIGLPFGDRNQGNIEAVAASLRAAEAERQVVTEALRRALDQTTGRIAGAQAAVRRLREDAIPAANDSYREVENAYRQGRLSYIDLLEARRALTDARLREIGWLTQLFTLRAELEWIAGRPLPALWEASR
ncbi:MAG TPA: TolC family protein [Candidatus Eisenbacteria bacterium]